MRWGVRMEGGGGGGGGIEVVGEVEEMTYNSFSRIPCTIGQFICTHEPTGQW